MATRDIVVIGASSGGIEALKRLVEQLPERLGASVFVVQHIPADSISFLPELLARCTALQTRIAANGQPFVRSHIYVAPPDHHLLIDSDQMFLSRGPRENRVRPAIDPLFRSAALSHGARSIGVILSGSLDDGTAGLVSVKKAGGLALVQDPADALTPDMPESALAYVDVDHCLSASALGELLGTLVTETVDEAPSLSRDEREQLRRDVEIMRDQSGRLETAGDFGKLAPVSCPECGGPMWESQNQDGFPHFRCHTGHAFTGRGLVSGLQEREEQSLWVALRVMEERSRMLRRLADRDEDQGLRASRQQFASKADEAEEHVATLRQVLAARPNVGASLPESDDGAER